MYLVRVYEDRTNNDPWRVADYYFCAGLYDTKDKADERMKELAENLIDDKRYVKVDILEIPLNTPLIYSKDNIDYKDGDYDDGPYLLGYGTYYE